MCVFGLGMCFSLLGAISIKLMPRLNIDTGRYGTLISGMMIACLVASLVVGVLIDAWGHKPFAIIGFILTALCIFVIARARTYGRVLGACLLLGVGAMCLNNVGNTLIPRVLFGGQNKAAALNLGNVFFGLGLFLVPLLVSFLLKKMTYEKAVSVVAVIVLLPVIPALLAEFGEAKIGFEASTAVALLGQPAVIVGALVLFCYISLEASFCNWIAPYGKEVISKDFSELPGEVVDATAQRMLSVFAAAMMFGRLAASQIQFITTHGDVIIAVMAGVAALVILAMTRGGAIWTSALVVCAGLAFAPCFPTIVGVTFEKFHESVHGTVFGTIFAVGLLSAVIIPKAIGNWAKGTSVQKSLRLLAPFCALLIVLALVLGRVQGPAKGEPGARETITEQKEGGGKPSIPGPAKQGKEPGTSAPAKSAP